MDDTVDTARAEVEVVDARVGQERGHHLAPVKAGDGHLDAIQVRQDEQVGLLPKPRRDPRARVHRPHLGQEERVRVAERQVLPQESVVDQLREERPQVDEALVAHKRNVHDAREAIADEPWAPAAWWTDRGTRAGREKEPAVPNHGPGGPDHSRRWGRGRG